MLNKTQKNCENKFCKLYTKTFMKLLKPKHKQKVKKNTMKSCKLYFCNEGCKGTILEEGKQFPKLNKDNKQIEVYGKKRVQDIRKELFKNKTNILIDNVHEKMPKRISKNYKKKGAISICDHYIPNGSIEYLSKEIMK